jgi:molybdate transport system ATP-binding protein
MKNVHLSYGKHLIFSGLNWTVNEGEKWLLKGRNGSGKSSLLSMITGDHPQAYANEIYLFGKGEEPEKAFGTLKKKRVSYLLNCTPTLTKMFRVLMQ